MAWAKATLDGYRIKEDASGKSCPLRKTLEAIIFDHFF